MKHTEKKHQAWLQQHGALQAPAYRITLTHQVKKGFNLGKRDDAEERFFTAEQVADKIAFLSAKNSQGYNIYVTPISGSEHYIVLDDTTQASIDELQRHGFRPCLVQESSPGNLQSIFRAQRVAGDMEQSIANTIVQRINQKYGDPCFSGVIHPFRLAGFANRKDKYLRAGNYPFVRIHAIWAGQCGKLSNVIKAERIKTAAEAEKQPGAHHGDRGQVRIPEKLTGKIAEDFRRLHEGFLDSVSKRGWPRDDSKLDFTVAVVLLRIYSAAQVEDAIKMLSPGVSTRHPDIDDYARRTVSSAQQRL